MEYSQVQLVFIQKRLKESVKSMDNAEGLGKLLAYADLTAWLSHANLAGYQAEKDTGRMYKQKDNVRTYFTEVGI